MGRRYLLMAVECGDGTARLPIGRHGLFEIDADGALTPVGATRNELAQQSLAAIRELIADLAGYDADVTSSGLIVGQVLDAVTNQPVATAKVQISGVDERDVQTTEDGWFVFRDVRAFTYDVAVTAPRRIGAKQRRVGPSCVAAMALRSRNASCLSSVRAAISSCREVTPVLRYIEASWFATVRGLVPRALAISDELRPART
jgi:hypothetical protein